MKFVGRVNPDRVSVEDHEVLWLTEKPTQVEAGKRLLASLAGQRTRKWFTAHFYYCLPLVRANQHGFVTLLEHDTWIEWNGGPAREDVHVRQSARLPDAVQNVHSHFGSGIVTIDHPWAIRTPRGINLFVGQPPNHFIDGLAWMNAVVETDNLRHDFTLNVKVTRPNHEIFVPAGTPIGWCMPIARHVGDEFTLRAHDENDVLEAERTSMHDFARLRHRIQRGEPGQHYRQGFDVYGNEFSEHEKG